jgi:hypothetical protein
MADTNPQATDWRRLIPSQIIEVQRKATKSAEDTKLPGHISGPNDALRHIIGAAELRRRYGLAVALAVLEGNERAGNSHNN